MASAQESTSKDELIVAATGHPTNGSHSSDMSKVDYEAVDYESPEELTTDKETELVEMKCLKEKMGLICERLSRVSDEKNVDGKFTYLYKFIHNSIPASKALKPAVTPPPLFTCYWHE